MNSSLIPIKTTEIKTIKHLEAVLKVKFEKIQEIILNLPDYYYEKKEIKIDKEGKIKMENGLPQYRIIYPSTGELKVIQKIIHNKILSNISLPNNIKGGVKGNDNVSNAKFHQGNKYKFVTDLKDFFPSISSESVIKTLIKNGFSKKIAILIAELTTYKGKIPQGTPTSGSLANLVFIPIDKKLIALCAIKGLKYTRYVDDLTFSSKVDFKSECNNILQIIISGGFRISRKKTFYKSGKIEVTGIEVGNNSINTPARINDRMDMLNAYADVNCEMNDIQKGLKNYTERVKKISKTKLKDIGKSKY